MDKSYLLIDPDILPPVFAGVIRAKELLAEGKVSSTAQAVKEAVFQEQPFISIRILFSNIRARAAIH